MKSAVETADYKVKLEIFEGPLDLLLYLIKKDEIDIQNISIQRITDQYLAYIETFKILNIDLASEFIVMAANLMYIKSRTLLPRQLQPPDEEIEEDDPRWELIRQGTPVAPNDMLIAAQALAHRLTVVTANAGEFPRVSGLEFYA